MPKHISFFLTQQQILDGTKTVTRRLGWGKLKPGELFWAVEKGQGLKKGEKLNRLALLRCVSNQRISLLSINQLDCVREGFPELGPLQFVAMFCRHMGVERGCEVNRIEFAYEESREESGKQAGRAL